MYSLVFVISAVVCFSYQTVAVEQPKLQDIAVDDIALLTSTLRKLPLELQNISKRVNAVVRGWASSGTLKKIKEVLQWVYKKLAGPFSNITITVIVNKFIGLLVNCHLIPDDPKSRDEAEKYIRGFLVVQRTLLKLINKYIFNNSLG